MNYLNTQPSRIDNVAYYPQIPTCSEAGRNNEMKCKAGKKKSMDKDWLTNETEWNTISEQKGIQRVIITTFFMDKDPEENLNRLSKVMNKIKNTWIHIL